MASGEPSATVSLAPDPSGRHAQVTPTLSRPLRMVNPIRNYDWGSRWRLAQLQGRRTGARPEAELWMGAHPSAPSSVVYEGIELALTHWIASDPAGVLGAETLSRFGPRLPFLLKVLGIDRALSIQVHPDVARAESGYLTEEAAGLPLTSPQRTFVDPYAKPEFVVALTYFEALAGFRSATETAAYLRLLDLPVLAPVEEALADTGLLGALAALVHWPAQARQGMADAVTARCEQLVTTYTEGDRPHELDGGALAGAHDVQAALTWVVQLAQEHPGDPLVTAPLLLRLHRVQPGGTIFLPPGVPHAYLRGTVVEIMGASDNVLRAGLTTKHVAVEELLAALDLDLHPVVGAPVSAGAGVQYGWEFPVPDFSLTHLTVQSGVEPGMESGLESGIAITPADSPMPGILLCTRGAVVVECAGVEFTLRSGESAFVPASSPGISITGDGDVFRAAPGPDPAGGS